MKTQKLLKKIITFSMSVLSLFTCISVDVVSDSFVEVEIIIGKFLPVITSFLRLDSGFMNDLSSFGI